MVKQSSTADLIHSLMLTTDSKAVSQASLKVMKVLINDGVELQILGIAAALLTILDRYGLNYIDVLGMADSIVFSGENNNMLPAFKEIMALMKPKKEIENNG